LNTILRDTLASLIARFGAEILDKPQRVKAFLDDFAPKESKAERNVLVHCLKYGFHTELKQTTADERTFLKKRFAQRLYHDEGINTELCDAVLDTLEAALFGTVSETPLQAKKDAEKIKYELDALKHAADWRQKYDAKEKALAAEQFNRRVMEQTIKQKEAELQNKQVEIERLKKQAQEYLRIAQDEKEKALKTVVTAYKKIELLHNARRDHETELQDKQAEIERLEKQYRQAQEALRIAQAEKEKVLKAAAIALHDRETEHNKRSKAELDLKDEQARHQQVEKEAKDLQKRLLERLKKQPAVSEPFKPPASPKPQTLDDSDGGIGRGAIVGTILGVISEDIVVTIGAAIFGAIHGGVIGGAIRAAGKG
jgi:hypothetical protein